MYIEGFLCSFKPMARSIPFCHTHTFVYSCHFIWRYLTKLKPISKHFIALLSLTVYYPDVSTL